MTPQHIEQAFTEYIQFCDNFDKEVVSSSGKVVRQKVQRVPTLGEFHNRLGITRETWSNYRKREGYEDYFDTVKKIDNYILGQKAAALINNEGSTTGLIFDLKVNHNWIDKQTIDQNITGNGIIFEIIDSRDKIE